MARARRAWIAGWDADGGGRVRRCFAMTRQDDHTPIRGARVGKVRASQELSPPGCFPILAQGAKEALLQREREDQSEIWGQKNGRRKMGMGLMVLNVTG